MRQQAIKQWDSIVKIYDDLKLSSAVWMNNYSWARETFFCCTIQMDCLRQQAFYDWMRLFCSRSACVCVLCPSTVFLLSHAVLFRPFLRSSILKRLKTLYILQQIQCNWSKWTPGNTCKMQYPELASCFATGSPACSEDFHWKCCLIQLINETIHWLLLISTSFQYPAVGRWKLTCKLLSC